MLYAIEKIWIDPLENQYSAAVGYDTVGYANTKEEAEEIVSKGGVLPKGACWAVSEDMPKFRYKRLNPFEVQNANQKA